MTERERRRYVRVHFKRQVNLEFTTDMFDDCVVKDISLGGMYIQGKFPEQVGDECYINLAQKAQSTSLIFRAQAKIVRQDDNGIALEFVSMPFESLLTLEMILLYEPGDDSSDKIELPDDLPFTILEEDSFLDL